MDSGSLLPKAKKNINSRFVVNALLLSALAFFIFLMARITLPYIPYNTDVGFLRIKQDYIDIDVWRIRIFYSRLFEHLGAARGFYAVLENASQRESQIASRPRLYLCDRRFVHHRPGRTADGFLRERRHPVKDRVRYARYRLDHMHRHRASKRQKRAITTPTAIS